MAPSRPSPSSAPSAGGPLRVRGPAELVAAIPVLLGFAPSESLVLVSTGGESGRRLGLTLRADLPPPELSEAVCAAAASNLLVGSPVGAVVVVVGGGPASGAGPLRRDVAEAAVAALEERGVAVHTAVWAERCAAASRWRCYDLCDCSGLLADPATTPLAAAAVAAGKVLRGGREELERLVAPVDAEVLRRREGRLERAVDELSSLPDPAAALDPQAQLAVVETAIAEQASGRLVLDDARVVALAAALAVPAVRDAALLACAGPRAAAAEQLWAALARETPDPEAAEPAALLAASALLRGDGALANVALERAEAAWPAHRLTRILIDAAQLGVSPERFRAWLGTTSGSARRRRGARSRRRVRRR